MWRMRVACWIRKAIRAYAHTHAHAPVTYTHARIRTRTYREIGYVILIAFARQHVSNVRCTYIACLVPFLKANPHTECTSTLVQSARNLSCGTGGVRIRKEQFEYCNALHTWRTTTEKCLKIVSRNLVCCA
jgi:hypothetical protein